MSINIYSCLENAAKKWPDNIAIIDEYGELSFQELLSQSNLLADKINQFYNLAEKSLGLMASNSREFIIALFAGAKIGATVVPLSHQLKKNEFDQIQEQVKLTAIIDDFSGLSFLTNSQEIIEVEKTKLRLSLLNDSEDKFAKHVENAALMRFTSGTTGTAKGVLVSHESVMERTKAASIALSISPQDKIAWVLPMAFHFIVSIITFVRYGASIVICKDIFAKSIIDKVNQTQASILYAAPMHYQLLAADKSEQNLDSLRLIISTASGINEKTILDFKDRYGKLIRQVYGIIEIGLPIGSISDKDAPICSLGKAMPGYRVGILDDKFQTLPCGQIGKLAISGPGMFDAYMQPPTPRETILNNSWFLTGDLALIDENGFINLTGREKSVINVSGNKVFPEEVEHVLNRHPLVVESKAYGDKHPTMGEIVAADIILEKNGSSKNFREIVTFCRENLSGYKVPFKLRKVDKISYTQSGKILRH